MTSCDSDVVLRSMLYDKGQQPHVQPALSKCTSSAYKIMGDYLTAEELEALDPAPDVHSLFAYYNDLYFNGKLGACSVEWSTKRMTM